MKLATIKTAVTSGVGRQILLTKKHSPTIMFIGGVAGLVGSTVLACKATLKLDEILAEAEADRALTETIEHHSYSAADRDRDQAKIKFRTAGKITQLYGPSIALGVISIGLLTGSHVAMTRRNTAIMAAYTALDKGFNQYRERVREELGDEKDLEFRHGTETRKELVVAENGTTKEIEHKTAPMDTPSIYARWFDEGSTSWQRSPGYNQVFLNCQQSYANDLLRTRGHVFLNEVYDMLGIERSSAGAVVGWVMSKDGDNFIDFGIYDQDSDRKRRFVNYDERNILLDFNVDGVIYDKI